MAFLLQAFLVKPYRIPSGSMLPTLNLNQRILVNRLDTHPKVGDVVVFHPPHGADLSSGQCRNSNQGFTAAQDPDPQPCDAALAGQSTQTFVKRVVGVGGDVLSIRNGHVYRNNKREPDAYIANCGGVPECSFDQSITVPKGEYYMLGDNRGDSDDSRFWGPARQSGIIGVAFFTYWPLGRFGTL